MRISDWSSDVCSSDLNSAPIGWRVADPMCRGRQAVIGQPLKHIADIDDQRAFWRMDRQPLAVAIKQFQPCPFCPQQEGYEVDVLMRSEERSVGKGCGSTCESRGSPAP